MLDIQPKIHGEAAVWCLEPPQRPHYCLPCRLSFSPAIRSSLLVESFGVPESHGIPLPSANTQYAIEMELQVWKLRLQFRKSLLDLFDEPQHWVIATQSTVQKLFLCALRPKKLA